MTTAAAVPRLRHPWALAIGLVLLVPEVVLAVLVLKNPIVVGLAGFTMTLGYIRLGLLLYRVSRERTPPVNRGAVAVVGLIALIVGAWLFTAVAAAAKSAADPSYTAPVAPAPVIGLNLLVIASAGVYICGLVLLAAAGVGAVAAYRRRG